MRLLKLGSHGELNLTKDYVDNAPRYAILSHTWGVDDDEVTFNDLENGSGISKAGYAKIQFCGKQAKKDGLEYFWVDTCCINKANHVELSEAIISMFRWYRDAQHCYVYLSDVSVENNSNNQPQQTWELAFRNSRWFTRGWTLQELIAPKSVKFFSQEEKLLGDKKTLEKHIQEITRVPVAALSNSPLTQFSIKERLLWAAKRNTKRKEDQAYCLLGIFDIFMPLIYGEGDNAFIRLKEEIKKRSGKKNTAVALIRPGIRLTSPGTSVPLDHEHLMVTRHANPLFAGRKDLPQELDGTIRDATKNPLDHSTQPYGLQSLTQQEEEYLHMFGPASYKEHKARNDKRVDGTCQWFLQNSKYISWQETDTSAILWVSADPGCGKSVLTKFLVDGPLMSTELSTTCYFFFKDDNTNQQSIARALCGLLHQIFVQKPHLLRHAVLEVRRNGRELPYLFSALWDLLLKVAQDPTAGEIVCVMDALDECEATGRFDLIMNLDLLYGQQAMAEKWKLKFLITSRPYFDIERQFRKLTNKHPTIRLAGEKQIDSISSEINVFIRAKIEEVALDMRLDQSSKAILEKELSKVTHRTYLWLKLIFDLISSQLEGTPNRIRESISTIPHTVAEAYEQILNKIPQQDLQRARKLLQIVVAAVRPLDLREMYVALEIEEGKLPIQDLDREQEETFQTTVRNLCGLFVCVINSKIYFIHQTAREFLISKASSFSPQRPQVWKNSIDWTESNYVLAEICIWYLAFNTFGNEPLEIYDEDERMTKAEIEEYCHEYPMLDYAAKHWASHFREAKVKAASALFQSSLAICDTSTKRFATWFQINGTLEELKPWNCCRPRKCCQLTLAANFGHEEVVKLLLRDGADSSPTSALPLVLAADHGYHAVVSLLLVNGESIDSETFYGTPLSNAVRNGHSAVVELLLEKGAKVNWELRNNKHLMGGAARRGFYGVVGSLLEYGADIESRDSARRSPLLLASQHDNETTIKMLLEKGADVDSEDGFGNTPLRWASINKNATAFMLMIKADANRIPNNMSRKEIFSWAVHGNHLALAKILMQNGICANFKGFYSDTSLAIAIEAGNIEIVELLLQKGAFRDCTGAQRQIALVHACAKGNDAVVKLLLEKWSVLDLEYAHDIKLLCTAAANGRTTVVQLLLRYSKKVNSKDESGQTPLHHAIRGMHEVIVEMLVQNGANTNSKNKEDRTPLWYAVNSGSLAIVTILLKNGADARADDQTSRELLFLAMKDRNSAMLELLLGNGADVNCEDAVGRTPLWYAVERGNTTIVELLLGNGADVNCEDAVGRTPLGYAVEKGYPTIVELLLAYGAKMALNDSKSYMPYLQAVLQGNITIVERCLETATSGELCVESDNLSTFLTQAASDGLEKILKFLLENGANPDTPDLECGRTLISWAASGGYDAVVNLLMLYGASVNLKDRNGRTALWHASSRGHEAVTKSLLEHGASVDPEDNNGKTPLWQASNGGYVALVALLLKRGARADPEDGSGRTALWRAASGGHEAVVDLLIRHMARINSQDNELRRSPISIAAWNGHGNVVKLLLNAGEDVDSQDLYQRSPFFWMAYFGNVEMAALLLDHGANIDLRDKYGQTPLLCAIQRGQEAMYKFLLEMGANPNSRDRDGWPPLWQAVKTGDEILMDSLLKKTAEIALTVDDQTLLSHAAAKGYRRGAELLLTYGAGADYMPSDYGRKPLSRAAGEGHGALVELLLRHGACIDSMDIEQGRTPLWWAADKGQVEVVKILLEKGADQTLEDNDGRTPLYRATARNWAPIVEMLKGDQADTA